MKKILALWAVPRSTSTAFEWMMRQRGDLTCLHEPYGEAWYQGENPLWPRFRDGDVRTPGLTLESVTEKLLELAASESVFIKDFPHYIDHMWSDELLSRFNHSFLIRHPAKTITSMYNKWPDFHPKEVGFTEQEAVGIPFIEEALSWEPGPRDEVSWWDGGSFHANLRDSDGLKPQARKYVEIGDVPARVKSIYDDCMVHYEYMHALRLQP